MNRRPWWRDACAAVVIVFAFLLWLIPRLQGPGHHPVTAGLFISAGMAVVWAALNVAAVLVPVRVFAHAVTVALWVVYRPVLRFQLRHRRDWS